MSIRKSSYYAEAQGRCAAAVFIKDTYRRTGRGRHGFEMHYDRERCLRRATHGEWCWQHKHGYTGRFDYGEYAERDTDRSPEGGNGEAGAVRSTRAGAEGIAQPTDSEPGSHQ